MRNISSPDIVTVRLCSKQEREERNKAIVDYYLTNRLIAYGDIHDESLPDAVVNARIEDYCLKMYKQDMERIRRKYALSDSKPGELPEGNCAR